MILLHCSLFLLLCTALAAALSSGASSHATGDFSVGPLRAAAGQKVSGFLEVPAGSDEGARIPITVINGARSGPVLALIAGTHGYEYPPITALQELRRQLDAAELSGAVILVHIANMPSFQRRTIYYSPVDGLNLNRVYPGSADGTVSRRIAHTITSEVIERADYLVDMHCGDGNESLRPYAYWMLSGDADLDRRSRQLAIAFGLDHIVIDADRPKDPAASLYTSNTAVTRGRPAITTETGGLGRNDRESVELALRGAWGVLRHLGMVPGEPPEEGAVIWLDRNEVVRSPSTGIFKAALREGYVVAEGALLGTLLDFFGETIGEIRAPFEGVVNYVIATPPIVEGEPVAMVSRIAEPTRRP